MPTGPLHVVGLKELQRDLRAIDAELPRELRKANLEAAKIAEAQSQSNASSLGGVQAKASAAIKAGAEQIRAKLTIDGSKLPYALGSFLGAKKYQQFPEWVGNSWEPGGPGGPYAIGAALRDKEDAIVDVYGEAIDRLMHTGSTVFGAGTVGTVTEF